MTMVKLKGLKRYKSKGRWYVYHRKTGRRLEAQFGSPAFLAELAALADRDQVSDAAPGSVGALLYAYRASPHYSDLATATKVGYGRMMNLLKPIDAMPLSALTAQFVAGLRDRVAAKHGRRQANYVMAVLSVACENGKEHGLLTSNPVRGRKASCGGHAKPSRRTARGRKPSDNGFYRSAPFRSASRLRLRCSRGCGRATS